MMEYTVQKLSRLAGISSRALRFYDEIGILHPARINSSGYRIYGQQEVERLQQIMFYRELGVSLERIKELMNAPDYDVQRSLEAHRLQLLAQRERLDILIANVEKTLAMNEGGRTMSDKERFEGFKQRLVTENEEKYGQEARQRYGDEAVERSNRMVLDMTEQDQAEIERLSKDMMSELAAAMAIGDPGCEAAQKAADVHRQWLCYFWPEYSKESHAGLAQMYVDDPRFTAYYDQQQPGTAAFLRDAIFIYVGMRE